MDEDRRPVVPPREQAGAAPAIPAGPAAPPGAAPPARLAQPGERPYILVRGPCETREFYSQSLGMNPMFTKLFARYIGYPPLQGEWLDVRVAPMIMILQAGRAISLGIACVDSDYYTVTMAEMLGPFLTADLFLPRDPARAELVRSVRALLNNPNRLSRITDATAEGYAAEYASEHHGCFRDYIEGQVHPYHVAAANAWPAEEHVDNITPEQAMCILYYIAQRAKPFYRISGAGIIAHVTIAIAKRGTISGDKLTKLEEGISQDLGVAIQLDADVIPKFYRLFGNGINDMTVATIFEHWLRILPQQALRLMLTVNQSLNSGLTQLIVISEALKDYPDFPWWKISRIFPTEWNNVIAALTLVDGNQYYGFKKDLGIVRSTNYKSIGYIAKELRVRIGGQASLNRYQGWATKTPNQDIVTTILDRYVEAHNANINVLVPYEADADDDRVAQIRAAHGGDLVRQQNYMVTDFDTLMVKAQALLGGQEEEADE